jgi:hypothetical protein
VTKEITEAAAGASLEDITAGVRLVDDVIGAALPPMVAQRCSLEVAWDYVCALSPQVKTNRYGPRPPSPTCAVPRGTSPAGSTAP